MQIVEIRKNAQLKKDDEGLFWLLIESAKGSVMLNLSDAGFDEQLEAFMEDQESPVVGSQN